MVVSANKSSPWQDKEIEMSKGAGGGGTGGRGGGENISFSESYGAIRASSGDRSVTIRKDVGDKYNIQASVGGKGIFLSRNYVPLSMAKRVASRFLHGGKYQTYEQRRAETHGE